MSTALDRAISALELDLATARAQRGTPLPGLADPALDLWIGKLERELAALIDERDLEDLSREILLAAVSEHNEQVEERKRQEAQP